MSNETQNKILQTVGRLEGKVDGIISRLDKQNGTLINHDKRINKNESALDQQKGKAAAISIITATIISIIGIVITFFKIRK